MINKEKAPVDEFHTKWYKRGSFISNYRWVRSFTYQDLLSRHTARGDSSGSNEFVARKNEYRLVFDKWLVEATVTPELEEKRRKRKYTVKKDEATLYTGQHISPRAVVVLSALAIFFSVLADFWIFNFVPLGYIWHSTWWVRMKIVHYIVIWQVTILFQAFLVINNYVNFKDE